MKIYFTNNWGEKHKLLGQRMITTTPNNLGKWKKIEYCKNLENADYVVSLGGLNKSINLKNKKTIVLQREPTNLNKFEEKNKNKNENILYFSYKKLHHAWTHPEKMQIDYDNFLSMKYEKKSKIKNLSTITSMRTHLKGCELRIEFIKKFCRKYNGIMDVYGAKWDNSLGINYKGELPFHNEQIQRLSKIPTDSKYKGLKNYKYSLCIENSCYDNYFTEKITDCLLSWTIPIYFGCTNIEKYFPEHSYYWIDINEPNSIDSLYEIIQKPITEKNVQAMEKARKLIMEKYNIWDLLNEIIN